MSLHPQASTPVPPQTRQVAQVAFPPGNRYLQLRDTLGTLHNDSLFADLFSPRRQAAQAPWQLAVVTLLQFAKNLSDRQAANAVRSRIDWKYLLGLELTDAGFDSAQSCRGSRRWDALPAFQVGEAFANASPT